MTGITHAFVSGKSDGGDATLVRPSSWNESHPNVGLVLLEQHTASSSATLDFAARNVTGQSGATIQSDFDDYLVKLVNVLPATNDVGLEMRMGTGAGPTYDTGANYGWMALVMRAGGTGITGAEGGATSIQLEYGSGGTVGISNTTVWAGCAGHFYLFDPGSTTQYKFIEGQTRYRDAEPFRLLNTIAGSYESTTAVTALRFYMSSGSIASGTIRVYGVANS